MFKMTIAAMIGITAIALQGCGTESIEGSWKVSKIQMDGMDKPEKVEKAVKELSEQYENSTPEEIQESVDLVTGIGLSFYEDGTMTMSQSGYGLSVNGTWTETSDNVYTINADYETTTVTLDGHELYMVDNSGENTYVFEKDN